jgi:hypothetical protein
MFIVQATGGRKCQLTYTNETHYAQCRYAEVQTTIGTAKHTCFLNCSTNH